MKSNLIKRIITVLVLVFAGGQWLFPNISLIQKIGITVAILLATLFINCFNNLYRFISMKVNKTIILLIIKIINLIWNPFLRLTYLLILLFTISYISRNVTIYYLSGVILLLYLLSISIRKFELFEAPLFADGFDESDLSKRWEIISGEPDVDFPYGKPKPSLRLKRGETRTHSFLLLNNLKEFDNGIIECDVILKPGSLVNICFRLQNDSRGYMARLDTRGDYKNSFLEKKGETTWEYTAKTNQIVIPGKWWHIKLIVNGSAFTLFKNEKFVSEWKDDQYKKGRVGIFNELGEVHVDNFIVRKLE